MEQNYNYNEQPPQQVALPNATIVLVFGILSIVGCCCSYGIIGIIFGIIALVMSGSALKAYRENPQLYIPSSYQNVNAGRICAIIGIIFSILGIIYIIWAISFIGIDVLTDPARMQEWIQQYQ